jgi:hypothetical protein
MGSRKVDENIILVEYLKDCYESIASGLKKGRDEEIARREAENLMLMLILKKKNTTVRAERGNLYSKWQQHYG